MKYIGYIIFFIFGVLVGKFIFEKKKDNTHEEIQIITNGVNNLSKLVVSEGNFAEIYSFKDSKKYFYDYIQFDKKAVISTNAKVEVGYDLSKLNIEIDSINKQIIINHIPKEEVTIIPNIKYITLQDSGFNEFTTEEHNKLREKAIAKIEETIELTSLKKDAKHRLLEELSKIFQLSKVYGWKVVNNTNEMEIDDKLMLLNQEFKD